MIHGLEALKSFVSSMTKDRASPRGVVKYWGGGPWGRTAIQQRVQEGGGNANCE